MTETNRSKGAQTRDLNIFLKLAIGLAIVRSAFGVFQGFMMAAILYSYGNANALVFSGFLSLGLIVCLLLTLRMQKTGVFGFFVLQLLNGLILSNAMAEGTHLLVAVLVCIVFALLLQLRAGGRSAWQVIFEG